MDIHRTLASPRQRFGALPGVFHHREMRVATFYSYLQDDRGQTPAQEALVHRVASFIGAIESDQLVPGPLLDTQVIDDVHDVLMLVGLKYEEMQQIRLNDGHARRVGWIAFDPVLAITPEIVFALNEPAARSFLLDLRGAVEMLQVIFQNNHYGCMIEVIAPRNASD
jgi:hypothetical protein